ncbi:hypothetical protein Poli38472_005669 [Pythium oligandrum]|uniref:Ubiquitin family protein n=1 Tax=Pythium oligandrum TaxID=41045 RepID=A0A8K1CGF2_PYTOL|nr:hypothetical protein Poli38472_005669 [Pythium oligandrum]|eukprot:TMW63051.1 hypothetical protein Poli38472_005669 [Pythium oligandrum]
MVQLFVKTTAGKKFSVEIELERTVAECKTALVAETEVPEAQQRLIFKGKVLKDDLTLASYGIAAEDTLYFVRGSANPRPTTATPAATTPASTPAPATPAPAAAAPTGAAPNAANPFGFPMFPPMGGDANGAGANPFGNMFGGAGAMGGGMPNINAMQQQMMQNPDMMRQMMESPLMQSVMNNPEIMRSIIQSNPAMQQLMEQNPQLNHIMNDPELLRQSMEAMRNPAAMREMMRSQDTALRNIESHPEGFNALRRMYHDVQEPLLDAASSGSRSAGPAFTMPGVAGGAAAPAQGQTNATSSTSAAPANPWATGATSAAGATNNASANPWAGGGLGGFGGAGGLGGLGGFGAGAPNPELMAQMMQSPLMQPMLDQIANNPQLFISQMEQMNPQMAAVLNANPQMRQMMMNPDFLRSMMNPQNIQAMMQMQNAMNQLRGTGLIPPGLEGMNLGGAPGMNLGGAPAGAQATPPVDFSALFGGGFGAPAPAPAPAPAGNPDEIYASQLTQLNDMGFSNRDQNVRALQATGGNVHAAVDRILSGLS